MIKVLIRYENVEINFDKWTGLNTAHEGQQTARTSKQCL